MILLYVGLGGAIGAMARYGAMVGIGRLLGAEFPFGTLCVNVVGSLLMGILAGLGAHYFQVSHEMRAFLAVGILGGFTTFSTFSMDVITLYQRQMAPEALLYIAVSIIFSLLFLVLGMLSVRMFSGGVL